MLLMLFRLYYRYSGNNDGLPVTWSLEQSGVACQPPAARRWV
jgi:hypothetical protein